MDIKDKFFGGIIGSALGDGIGELAFSRKNNKDIATFETSLEEDSHPYFEYTDDTAMALGIMESLIANQGQIIEKHLGDTFAENYNKEPWRGYARGPNMVFTAVKEKQITYTKAAQELFDGGSFGNGAAMRIAPIGVCFYEDMNLYEKVAATATVTHAHPIAIDGAAVLALAIAQAMKLDPTQDFPQNKFLDDLIAFCRTSEMREKMEMVKTSLSEKWAEFETAKKLKLTVCTHESVPFAIYSFLIHPKSYKDCLYCSALNGGDRDTMGAMAAAISGAYLGLSAIPQNWVKKLERKDYFQSLIEKLFEIFIK